MTRSRADELERRSPNVLEVRDLVVRFRQGRAAVHAVNGVSFDLEPGATLGLVGESGCGKSVTSLAVMRLLPPGGSIEGGSIRLAGRDVLALPEPEMRSIRGKDLAMVFQDPMTNLNPVLTIGEQVEETILAHERVGKDVARERAIGLLGEVGIPDPAAALGRFPHEFSGGMRQRVMIAIALALGPKVLIADEPTTALDVTIQAQVLDLMRRLTRGSGTALVLITHDLGVVAGIASQVAVMYAGFIVERASSGALFGRPRHPYTVGLMRSLPRPDMRLGTLTPIDGSPPDQRREPRGCPFAPRCAWRLDVCWSQMPPLAPDRVARPGAAPDPDHRVACHNPVEPEEVSAGRPLREGFAPAAPPSALEAADETGATA